MRTLLLLSLAGSLVTAQSTSQDGIVGDQTPATTSVELLDEEPAVIDCSEAFECDLMSDDPVCGSDGVTYANDCVFTSVFCSSEQDADSLFIQALGECPSSSEDPEDNKLESLSVVSLPMMSNAQPSVEVDLLTVFCSLTCKLTPDKVCGTDRVTYINDCHLLSSKCEHPELEKVSHGECKSDNSLNILEVNEDLSTDAPLTSIPEKCNPMCERIYDPICGSDGITYANLCLLEYAECRNPNVQAFGPGKCPPYLQAARPATNPASNNNNVGEPCIPGPCPYTYAPVCGSDGQTHENLCLFANARCQAPQHALSVLHDGECDADTQLTCETMTCPTFTACREQVEPDDIVVAYCVDVCSPDRCSEREDCELVDSDCYTAPCSPIAMCIPKLQDDWAKV